MRIAFLVDKCSPIFTGGYENRYLSLAKRLAPRHAVRIFTSMETDRAVFEGVEFMRSNLPSSRNASRFDRNLLHSLDYSIKLLRCPFGGWQPDAIIVEAIPFAHLAAMNVWARNTGSALVLNVNEAWFNYSYFGGLLSIPSRLAVRYFLRKGLSFSDVVITISRATALSLTAYFGVKHVSVVPVGIDFSKLSQAPLPEQASRRFDIVTVGRAVAIKRHADLLHALAILRARTQWNGRAVVIGDGPQLPTLKRLAQTLGLSNNVDFLGSPDDETKFRVLSDAKVFVLCSEREGFSLATLEAQACGAAPVVARPSHPDVFGVSDIVQESITGLFYPVGDIESLASALARLLKDGPLREAIGRRCRVQAESYSWDRIASEFESQLVEIGERRTA